MINESKRRALSALKAEEKALFYLKKTLTKPCFDQALQLLQARAGRIIVTGIGKSGFVGQKMAATFTSLGHPSLFLHPVEALHGDLGAVAPGDIVVAISFSGESNEIIKIVKQLRRDFEVKVIALTNSSANTLGKLADVVLELSIDTEGCPLGVAPMASTMVTLVMGDMLAAALTEPQTFKKDHFARFHPGGGLALSLKKVEEVMTSGVDIPLVKGENVLAEAVLKMSGQFKGVTGVVNNQGVLIGVITDGDIRRHLASSNFRIDSPVKKIMTTKPKVINPNASIKEALGLMEQFRVTSLFVVEKKKPVGIIHIHDIVDGYIV